MFFLATPHRGSDYAATLNNVLTISGIMSSRHYITDITTGSISAQQINEEFGKHASGLPIFSFYETLQMKIGISSSLIVDKDSAILGMTLCLFWLPVQYHHESLIVLRIKVSVSNKKEFSTLTQIIGTFVNSIAPMIQTTRR